jgi:Mg-chelatase subunit ChlD
MVMASSIRYLVLVCIFVLPSALYSQSRRVVPTPTPTPSDIEKVTTEEVRLNVLAFNDQGKFFPGVSEKDLVITDNDILHQPSSVRRIPANVLIVMDTGGELRSVKSLDLTRRVAREVVSALRPEDSVALMQYSDKPEIVCEWTTDREQLARCINKTNFGRRDSFVSALDMARDFLTRIPTDNRHLVLITDGTDSKPGTSAKFDAFQRLAETDISVHVISYTSLEAADIEPRAKGISNSPPPSALPQEVKDQLPNGARDIANAPKIGPTINLDRSLIKRMKARKADLLDSEDKLSQLAENTNGEFILPYSIDEMLLKAPTVSKMIDAAYVVTYMPKVPINDRKGLSERTILVTSKRDGLVVQARRKLLVDNSN